MTLLRLLPVEHCRQEAQTACLTACAQMALRHIGIHQSQAQLNRLLDLTPVGIPAPRIRRLQRLGVHVAYATGDEDTIRRAIERGIPPIVFLLTGDLPYWNISLRHAVLVVGYDDAHVYLRDPAYPDGPQKVGWGDFVLAWSEFDYRYATLEPQTAGG